MARHLVVFLERPGGQSQFSAALSLQSTDDRFAGLHDWIGDNLSEDLSLPRLAGSDLPIKRIASRCGFGTEETMRRSFLRIHGVSPQDYRGRFGP